MDTRKTVASANQRVDPPENPRSTQGSEPGFSILQKHKRGSPFRAKFCVASTCGEQSFVVAFHALSPSEPSICRRPLLTCRLAV